MKTPLVSIIIPNYNRASLIGETLDSILAQTYFNWECLVVDDGSTDTSEEIVRDFCKKDKRIQFHKRPSLKRKGANACRNYGLELSKGKYINWFDSDDIMHKDKLKLQVGLLEQSEYPFCVCQSFEFNEKISNGLNLRYKNLFSKRPFEDFLSKKIVWLTQAPMFRRQFLLDNKLMFDEELHAGQEWEFFSRILFNHNKYCILDLPLVYIRRHSNSISDNPSNDKLWFYYLARYKIYKRFNQKLSSNAILTLNRNFLFFYKNFVKNRNFKRAFIIWKNCLIHCKKFNYSDHKNLVLGYLLYYVFNRGDVILGKVSLYKE